MDTKALQAFWTSLTTRQRMYIVEYSSAQGKPYVYPVLIQHPRPSMSVLSMYALTLLRDSILNVILARPATTPGRL